MNLLFGIVVGILLTIGTAFIADAYSAPEVTTENCSKQIVNWDVAKERLHETTSSIATGWDLAEFENDIRRERQTDGIAKAKNRGVKFGRKPQLLPDKVVEIQNLRAGGATVPDIIKRTGFSKASIYRALGR